MIKLKAEHLSYRIQDAVSRHADWGVHSVGICQDLGDESKDPPELDESTINEINDLVMKNDVIELFESICCEQRDKILNAAMKVTSDDAARLRSQIEGHVKCLTPIDKAVYEAAQFAVSILELREARNPEE